MRKQLWTLIITVLILFHAGQEMAAQTPPLPPPPPPPQPAGTTRAAELAEQLRRARASQQSRPQSPGVRQSGSLVAMNLRGLETFGDALGGIPQGTDTFFVTEQFTFGNGMFDGSGISGTTLMGQIQSLNGGPALSFSLPFSPGQTVSLTNDVLPSGLASEVVAYLGRGAGGGFEVTYSPGLLEYAMTHGIDPSQLALDTNESYVIFDAADFNSGQIVYNYISEYKIPTAPGGIYGLGRQKITENMTPVPTDRLIFDYSYFHNVPLPYGKMPVNRFTPGFEKTFFSKRFSLEMRFPFAATIDNTLHTNNENQLNVLRIGDATAILKWLAFSGERSAVTLGLGISLPFADDSTMVDAETGRTVIRSKHESFHLMPYIGLLYLPNERVFFQSYFQVDASANGNPVYVSDLSDPSGNAIFSAGKTRERTYAYTSLSLGYWLHRQYDPRRRLTRGLNVMSELHWTQSLDRATGVRNVQDNYIFDIGNNRGNYTVVNMTLGTRYLFNEKTNIGIGYSVPLSNTHRQFDGELRLAFNRYF